MKVKFQKSPKKELEAGIEEAKKHLQSESVEELKAATEKLQQASHKVAD